MAQLSHSGPATGVAILVKDEPPHHNALMNDAATRLLSGKHALLVEDQTLIALDTEMLLRELGAAAVDAFTNVESALGWLASATPDVGVLDINLGVSSSFSVASELQRRQRPFIFTTGYGEGVEIPDEFVEVEIVRKPYTREALAAAFAICLGKHPAPL
jgi:CheY-like chemotaxis protein